jgi:hypothetical protein
MGEPIEEVGAIAYKCECSDCVTAVIELPTHLYDHSLIDVEPRLRDLLQYNGRLATVDQAELTHRGSDAYEATVNIADRALPIIDQENLAGREGRLVGTGVSIMGGCHGVRRY